MTSPRKLWNEKLADFKTGYTATEIREGVESEQYGTVGRWLDEFLYVSLDGVLSKGSVPHKLQTFDEAIPISEKDIDKLLSLKVIQTL